MIDHVLPGVLPQLVVPRPVAVVAGGGGEARRGRDRFRLHPEILVLVADEGFAIGEQAPKNLAIRYPKAVSLLSAPALVAFTFVFWPIIWLLNSASNLLLKVLGLGGASHAELAHTEEELRHILGESAAGGVLSRRERHMIENVLNLEEKTAQRVIVPRADIVYLSLAQPLEENLRLARQSGHTRYPLCVDDLTRVVGMVHVKDLFRALQAGGRVDLRQVARKVPFVSLSLPLDKLLLEFQRNRVHMAMLLDEEGKHVVGMAFLEDVLEELVGPIQDEFDKESPHIQDQGDGVYRVSGLCPIDELAEVCQMNIPETDMATVAGLVLEHLGRMANPGDSIEVDSRRITVVEAEPTRIHLLRVEPIPAPDGDE